MSYDVHVKTEYLDLELRELLQQSPSALLGVSADAAATLGSASITTIYDLALGAMFRDATRVVEAAADPSSIIAKHGAPPSDLIAPANPATPIAELAQEPVESLVAVSPALATALGTTMAVVSVRDLAQWPPYLAAVAVLTEALAPEKATGYNRDDPADLVARVGDYAAHQVRYTGTVLIESKPTQSHTWDGGLIDISALSPAGFEGVAFGAIQHYTQTWTPRAVTLGQLLHSLPLAPGESTRLTVVDWLRRVAASTEEQQAQAEQLSSALRNSTVISEVTRAVAHEFQKGDSVAGSASVTTGSSSPGLLGLLGVQGAAGSTVGTAGTYSTSYGSRAVSASALQSIDARTQQNSALARTKRAAIVSEVSESESESINTRVVINNNHMHSMSVQYYEVVQAWETRTRLDATERCIFIPMRLVNFANEQALRRYLPILADAALDRETRALLEQYRHTVLLRYPFERFAATALDQVRSQAGSALEQRNAEDQPVPTLPFALSAAVEKQLRLAQLQAQVRSLRALVQAEGESAVRTRTIEDFDRVGLQQYEIDREAAIAGVAWDGGQIAKVTLKVAGGRTQVLTTSADRRVAGAQQGYEQSALPIDQLESLEVSLTATAGASPSDYSVIRLWLLLALRGRFVWLDIGFVASRHQAVDMTVLQNTVPVDLGDLMARLMAAQLHYSQSIWLRADRQSLLMQLAPYVLDMGGTTIRVVEWMDPAPVTVAGNYLAFRFTYEADEAWQAWKAREAAAARTRTSLIPLPTGGVFAEAVLGEFNAAEKLDTTRFWKWQESPIPNLAPEIAATAQGGLQRIEAPGVTSLPDAVVSLQQPLALPALGNSEALLKTLMVSKLFNDMSGVEITQGLLKASIEASRDGDLAAAKQANDTLKAITDAFGKLLAAGTDGGENLTKTAKGLGSLFNLADKGDAKAGTSGGGAASSAVEAGTSASSTSQLGDFVVGDGASALASVGDELGPILDAIGPAALALLA